MAVDLGDGNTTRYYSLSDAAGLTLPDGPWFVLIWTRIEENSGSAFQYLISTNGFEASNSFNLYMAEAGVGPSDRNRWTLVFRDGSNAAVTLRLGETGADGEDRLVVAMRDGDTLYLKSCVANETTIDSVSADITGYGASNGGDWNIGRRVDGNTDRYFEEHFGGLSVGATVLSDADIQAIASGTRPQDLSGVTVLGYWPFTAPDATVADVVGSNDATRHGTNYPPASPDFPGTAGGADATATPAGVEATGEIGTVSVSTSTTVPLTGVEAAGETGTVTVSSGINVTATPSGVAAAGDAGTVSIRVDATATVTGVEGEGETGSVTVAGAGDTTAAVSGVSASGEVGTAQTVFGVTVSVSGVFATGEIGTVEGPLQWEIATSPAETWVTVGEGESIWDEGASIWDEGLGVVRSIWDAGLTPETWTQVARAGQTWTVQ